MMRTSESACPKALLAVAAMGLAALIGPGPACVHAQATVAPAPESAETEETATNNFTVPDRRLLQVLARAQKAIEQRRFGEAVEGIAEILRNGEDYLLQPDRKESSFKSLKAEARRILGELPREGRDLYEVRHGNEARQKLEKAAAAGDGSALAEISSRFFHTEAGYEATYLLALHHLDQGEPAAGALTLKRLREAGAPADRFEPGLSLTLAGCYYQAGMNRECQEALIQMKRRQATPSLRVAGRDIPWFEQEGEAVAWLAKHAGVRRAVTAADTGNWTMFRGNPARNGQSPASPPLMNYRWKLPVTDEAALEKGLSQQQAMYRERDVNVLSGLHPLAIDDVILMRTATDLLAIDFHNGKRLWQSFGDDEAGDAKPASANVVFRPSVMNSVTQYGQRIWDDMTFGTTSSDGRLVYVLEELSLGVTGHMGFIGFGGRGDRGVRNLVNRLRAYDLRTGGKVCWELGGHDDFRQPDTFFLGAPLCLHGKLFVIAEIKDEIRLLALDPATGNRLWQQQLATVDTSISQEPVRRLAGIVPSYADGILICPTGSGCVVAIDLATRSLLWGYVFSRPGETGGGRRFRGMNQIQMAFMQTNGGPVPRWRDGAAVIANGRVLLTPAEADMLYCLNLTDGKPAWTAQQRGGHYYVACVHRGVVVLVGRKSIDAIQLEDGGKAWDGRTVDFPGGASLTGHGVYTGKEYFVPLSSGEVVNVDLDAGKIVAASKSRRSSVPGNLIAYRGRIISQGLAGLEVYYQVDAAREEVKRLLAANPDDTEGLTLRGEMSMDAGKSGEAVADFRRAFALDAGRETHTHTRDLLRDALLAGLRDDFAAHQPMAGELEKLLDDNTQWAHYLRSMALGYQAAGDWTKAVAHYMKLADLEEPKPGMETVDTGHLVRRDRWVQGRLARLRRDGGAAAAAELDKVLQPRLEEARRNKNLDALKRFLAFFDGQPQAVVARTELLQGLTEAGRLLEAELILNASADSSDRASQAAALTEVAAMYHRAGKLEDAAACYRQLSQRYADLPCGGSPNPSAWLATQPNGDALRNEVARGSDAWPQGEVNAEKATGGINASNRGIRYDMPFDGPESPFFADYTVLFDGNRQAIVLRDGLGRERPPVSLMENGRFGGYSFNPNMTLSRGVGHLLIVSVGTRIFALDPWKMSGRSGAILWNKDTTSAGDSDPNNPFGNHVSAEAFRANPFGPVNSRIVCFQRVRNLVAVDPLSGEQLWTRQGIPQGSEVFGDEKYVFVVSPGQAEATVYGAMDGALLGTRKVPQPIHAYEGDMIGNDRVDPLKQSGKAFLGRHVLTWSQGPGGNGRVLSFFDPWEQRPIWPSRNFASGSRVDLVEDHAVGVMEPDGHFVLLALRDGQPIADLRLKLRPNLPVSDLVVSRMADRYFVLAHDARMLGKGDSQTQSPQGMRTYGLRRARVYALDPQGKLVWPEPVDVDHQFFLQSQPRRLPVLLFGGFRSERVNNQMKIRTSILAIDRRHGRVLYDQQMQTAGNMFTAIIAAEGNPEDRKVRISANNDSITLTFTDKPVSTAPARSTEAKKPQGELGKALRDAAGQAFGPPE